MSPFDLLLAPARLTRTVVRAADDLNAIAERARREPDPFTEAQERLSLLLADTAALNAVAREIVTGGEDLRQTGEALKDTAGLIESHLQVFAAALPRLMEALGAVETVADTIEPLQGVTNGVGKVAKRLK